MIYLQRRPVLLGRLRPGSHHYCNHGSDPLLEGRRIYARGQPTNDLSRYGVDESALDLDDISGPQSSYCAMNWLGRRRAPSKSNVHAGRPEHDVAAF